MKKYPADGVGMATEQSLCLPFPLRPDLLAQIIVPIDMTKKEADALSTFIMSLAGENHDKVSNKI